MSDFAFTDDALLEHAVAQAPAAPVARVWPEPEVASAQPWSDEGLGVQICSREQVLELPGWRQAFAHHYKDHRYYDIVSETLHPEFVHRYLVLTDLDKKVLGVQPYFVLDQDMLTGASGRVKRAIALLRKRWPKFLFMRTLMVGCVAGEGHLDVRGHLSARPAAAARLLAEGALKAAKAEGAQLVVFKEFKQQYRPILRGLQTHGFVKVPSLPMTRLAIDFKSFEEYFETRLGRSTRKDLRRKFKVTEKLDIELSVVNDISDQIDELYPLYLQVYERSTMRFEKLSKEYLCELGRRMPDRARFFVWRLHGKAIAFNICLVGADSVYDKYIGLDYTVAHDLHLYHYTFRDILSWTIANGYKWYCSTALNYDPKYHWRMRLDPLDLYVRHSSPSANLVMKRVLPLLEPTKNDANLRRFANFEDLTKN